MSAPHSRQHLGPVILDSAEMVHHEDHEGHEEGAEFSHWHLGTPSAKQVPRTSPELWSANCCLSREQDLLELTSAEAIKWIQQAQLLAY